MVKTCSKCKQSKPLSKFYKDRQKKNGLGSWCKECAKAQVQAYRLAHPEIIKARKKKYYQSKKGKIVSRRASRIRRQRYPQIEKAHRAINNAIRDKKLEKPTKFKCKYCPKKAQQYHHPDYSKPFEIEPICKKCHFILHRSSEQTYKPAYHRQNLT